LEDVQRGLVLGQARGPQILKTQLVFRSQRGEHVRSKIGLCACMGERIKERERERVREKEGGRERER
jgi:hypothetical protein